MAEETNSKVINFTDEEKSKMTDIYKRFSDLYQQIGDINIRILDIKKDLENATSFKSYLEDEYYKLSEESKTVTGEIEKKYGPGTYYADKNEYILADVSK